MTFAKDEPLPDKIVRDTGKNKDLNLSNQPAASGFGHFWAELGAATREQEERIEKIWRFFDPIAKSTRPLKKLLKPYIRQNRKLFWPVFLLLLMVLLPWISEASISKETQAQLKAVSQPLDPVKTGQLALNINQLMPPELYLDPDKVVLDKMMENESLTLAQQLSVNAGVNVEEPQRQDPTYVLQKGETVLQVANKFDLHVGSILEANELKAEEIKSIKPGTTLKIPSSDTDTSDNWLVAINRAEAEAKAKAETEAKAKAEAEAKKKREARVALAAATDDNEDNSIVTQLARRGTGYGTVKVLATNYSQCLPWAREQTGIQIRGYAGAVQATQSEPRVGGIALDRFFGHASVVVGVGEDTITVQEANFIRGKITERVVSKSAIRGYVY